MLRRQMDQVLDGIALGLLGKEIDAGNVIERQEVEPSGTIAKAEMDSRFDYGVRIRCPLERANVDVIVVNLPHSNADIIAEAAEVFIDRIGIGLDWHLARWTADVTDRQRWLGRARARLGVLAAGARSHKIQGSKKNGRGKGKVRGRSQGAGRKIAIVEQLPGVGKTNCAINKRGRNAVSIT